MNSNILDAVDTVYLQAFRENLLHEALRTHILLKQFLRQSASLATAQELPLVVRQNYKEVAECLPPLITAFRTMLDQLEEVRHAVEELAAPVETAEAEAMAMLDAGEDEILNALNEVGKSLGALPPSIVTWDDCALLRTHISLRPLTERPCYDSEIDICVHPFLMAEYSSKHQAGAKVDRWPHYLVNEIVPISLLPLSDRIHVEVVVRGEGYMSWTPRGQVRDQSPGRTGVTHP